MMNIQYLCFVECLTKAVVTVMVTVMKDTLIYFISSFHKKKLKKKYSNYENALF